MKTFSQILSIISLLLLTNSATASNQVVATLNAGVNPSGLAIFPNGQFAYVANNNNYGIAGADSVTVINLQNNTVYKTITHSSFQEPYTITINTDGSKAYVTNSNSTTIAIIDTSSHEVTGVIDGFDGPSGMVITPDGKYAYVNNYGGPEGKKSGNASTLRVVDMKTHTIIGDPIRVDLAPAALAMSPDGKFVYSANYVDGNPETGSLNVISTKDNKIVNTLRGLSGPFAIAITPDGKYAYITNFGSNNFAPFGTTVSVIDLNSVTFVATIDLGIQPSGIAISPDGKYAYATNYNTLYAGENYTKLTAGTGTVNIIDIQTNQVIAPTIEVGESPSAIAIAPNGKYAYVSTYTSNTVNVIELK